jgi:pentatricopeptide repeat protein
MISVYSKASDQKKLLLLLDEMIAGKVEFTLITYNALITSCAKVGGGKGALKWMERLMQDVFQPNNISYDQVVKALSHAGEPELAHEMCIEANRLKLVLSESAYSALASASKIHGVPQPKPISNSIKC